MPDDDIGKQMQAFHAMRDFMAAIHGPGCLENAPDGEETRLPDAQTKRWEKLGISRATWYRQGKPASASELRSASSLRQKNRARSYECSVRTIQRQFFVGCYGIPDLYWLAHYALLPFGMLEEIAKWEHEDQRQFITRLVDLCTAIFDKSVKDDPPWAAARISRRDEDIKKFGPVGVVFQDLDAVKPVARQARREIEIEIVKRWQQASKQHPATPDNN